MLLLTSVQVLTSELDETKPPGLDVTKIPEMFKQTFLNREVYSTIAYFINKGESPRPGAKQAPLLPVLHQAHA